MNFEGKVVFITGAGKGIGKVAAQQFSDLGATVVLAARTTVEVEAAAKEINDGGGRALAQTVDIANGDSIQAAVDTVVAKYGKVDVLVNNAATAGPPGKTVTKLVDMDVADWDLVYGVNSRGTMLMSKACIPHIPAGGSIINLSSTAGRSGMSGRTHYCSSKASIIGFTKALSHELGPDDIRVNCVVPGSTRTELLDNLFRRMADEAGVDVETIIKRQSANSPQKRIAGPDEVAQVIVFLASDAASAMNGQSLDPNAGSFML